MILSKEQLDSEVERLTENIQQAAWNNTTPIQMKVINNKYSVEIKELVAEKRKARKRWQQTRAPSDKNKLNNLTQQLKREI